MRFTTLIAASLALVLGGCAPAAAPSQAPPATEATEAQHRWESRHIASYAYNLDITCFCIHRGTYAIEVRNGEITSVRNVATGAAPPAEQVEWMMTVDRLFATINDARQAGKPVRATYHPELGYPTEAEIGMLADDSGTLYRITNLRAL